ncbi:MAG TPA: CBS domain-containing protein [Armatimonadota bacterium]|nr:CBS domain-containing protein [Armatimonadota bacterium]
MQFLTQVLGRTVFDSIGEPVGKVRDVIITPGEPLPVVSAIVIARGRQDIVMPWRRVREEVDRFSLPVRKDRIAEYTPGEDDIWLRKSVLDRQIVDIHDYKVVRVNDVRFVETPGQVCLLGVDASTRGLLRGLGIDWVSGVLRFLVGKPPPERIIAWNDVETLEQTAGPIKLKIPLEKLSRLHPSDIADIIEQMNPAQRADVIESLDVETAADVLPEASPEIQAEIIEDIDPERASDILEEMEPDEAADILGDLSEERTEEILKEMEPEEAEDVRELLTYEDETAGGLMTTEYVAVSEGVTAQGAIDYLRELAPDAETIYYIYILTEGEKLVGVISLRDLIVAQPDRPVRDFMVTRVIHIHPEASMREAAELFQKYNLLALPVVDFDNELKGIITVDDVLEDIPAEIWRGKPGRRRTAPDQRLDHTAEA